MPLKPCTAWPTKGKVCPVSRIASLLPVVPITLNGRSMRTGVGPANLPEVANIAGASAGGAAKVMAGSTACPASTAGKVCGAGASAAPAAAARATSSATSEAEPRWKDDMRHPQFDPKNAADVGGRDDSRMLGRDVALDIGG